MTSTLPLHPMYAHHGIRFTDPFAAPDSYHQQLTPDWTSHLPRRAPTPPPDMNGVQYSSKLGYYEKEHAQYHGDYMSTQQVSKAPGTSHPPLEMPNNHVHRSAAASQTQTRSQTLSPTPTNNPQEPVFIDSQPQVRRGSQANAIAPSFQIPRSVNDSGGSLSELAAKITCLFWFESADLLQMVEDSATHVLAPRPLISDATPTTGFMKWVTTILSTTLVAQNVVLLALLLIYRLKKLNPTVRGKPGSEYRLLTVALMLGNKFLDDNTYTNKTWAEVSGIIVAEIHIMEVEFLSNMKYCLFTSVEEWTKWHALLGKFAAFVESTSKPQRPVPILPPASSLQLPMALPSPPASNQASPPYTADTFQNGPAYGMAGLHGPTPAPSPLALHPSQSNAQYNNRKRSLEESSSEPAPKRIASAYNSYTSPNRSSNGQPQQTLGHHIPRLTLPSLPTTVSGPSSAYSAATVTHGHHLPPLNTSNRAMAMIYPSASSQVSAASHSVPSSQLPSQLPTQYQSRPHSPRLGSAAGSPTRPIPTSATSLHHPTQISPSYFLQQRESPYRPVHHVSTLLYPPPSAALHQRSQNIEYSQMHYQPLGKPFPERLAGRLPYVAQNVWVDGNQQPMTPVHQWPSFPTTYQQPQGV